MRTVLTTTVLLSGIFFLSGCVNSENSTPPLSVTPMPSDKAKIIKMEPITKAERALLKNLFTKYKFIELSGLLITAPDDSEKLKNFKKISLQNASAEDKKVMAEIQSNCLIEDEKIEKSGPEDQVGAEVHIQRSAQLQNKGPDDTNSATQCPISYVKDSQAQQVLLESNIDQLNKEFQKSKDPQVFNRTFVRKKIEEQKTEVTDVLSKNLRGDREISKYEMNRETKMDLTFIGSEKNRTVKVKNQYSAKGILEHIDSTQYQIEINGDEYLENDISDYFMTVTIDLPDNSIVIQAVKSRKKELTEYYLNGELKTKAQILEEINLDIESFR